MVRCSSPLISSQIPDDVKGAKDFTAALFVGCILRCLRLFDKERDYPRQLATSRAEKVKQANQLVKALQVRLPLFSDCAGARL